MSNMNAPLNETEVSRLSAKICGGFGHRGWQKVPRTSPNAN